MTVPGTNGSAQLDLFESAVKWHESGCSVIPILANGTKRPAIEWKRNQTKRVHPSAYRRELDQGCGIGLICGEVSGNLELTEIEARATSAPLLMRIYHECARRNIETVWISLNNSLSVLSPSGGLHLIYRIEDHPVPGNTKIARRPATAGELAESPLDKTKVLAETRGEGGYFVAAPTGGTVHPSGQDWKIVAGQIGDIPTINWAERNALHAAIHAALDDMPKEEPRERAPRVEHPVTGSRPGDDFNERADWADILEPEGWTYSHTGGNTVYWVRPGKDRKDGHSATTGHAGRGALDRLYVMSSATDLPTEEPLSKFYVYAHYSHGGDQKAAARELGRQGYGERLKPSVSGDGHPAWEDWGATSDWADDPNVGLQEVKDKMANLDPATPTLRLPKARGKQDWTLTGAADRFIKNWGSIVRYVVEEKSWRVWNGQLWERDEIGSAVSQAFAAMTETMLDEVEAMERQAAGDEDQEKLAKAYRRHITTCRNTKRSGVLSLIAEQVTTSITVFDSDPRYMNLQNGVYDMVDDAFLPHDPKYMLTKVAGVAYDPDAKAPRSEVFFSDLLPSEEMREFTLKALAYSLTGEADRKALFISQGPSNSGKTQVAEMMQGLFGEYAVAVSPGTFTKRREHGPNAELHAMRGARFVYTSETSYDIQLDEELVKRVTGKDTMTTRTLYEKPQWWIPQCAVWIATNNLPRFSSDGEAMWRRVKTIRFENVFADDGSTGREAIPNIGRTLAAEEGSGLFNLLLEALRRYRAAGRLVEPQELRDSVIAHRQDTDPLVQWVSVVQEKGWLVAEEGAEANIAQLRKANSNWCQDQGCGAMAAQRFGAALASLLKYDKRRSNGETLIIGWRWTGPTWMTGSQEGWQKHDPSLGP